MHANKQSFVAETEIDENFYQLIYASDRTTLLAESLDIVMPGNFAIKEIDNTEEEEAIISFFERDNVNLVAFLNTIDNETFAIP